MDPVLDGLSFGRRIHIGFFKPQSETRNDHPCLMRQLCAKNYCETVLHCHFYCDIHTLSFQRVEIPLNYRQFMYRNDMNCGALKPVRG